MAGGSRPVGRQKRVGSGSGGGVFKRGSGLGKRTGGPVGSSSGYSGRPSGSFGVSGGTGPLGGAPQPDGPVPNRGVPFGGGCLKLVLVGLAILFVLYFLSSLFGDGGGMDFLVPAGGQSGQGFVPPSETAATTYIDRGPYDVDDSVSSLARPKRTVLKGDGTDTVTIMVYMCATDLEARSGMATADLNEMLHSDIASNVNVIVETGGASRWQNTVISNTTNQRYQVTEQGLRPLEKNLGKRSMVDPRTLADFITYSARNFPADRYMLVLWDHGAGSLNGYGYDEFFPRDTMTLAEVASALKAGGTAFDIIGFDACLMSTVESAVVLEPYADYMIASEEVEPGIGWHYTGWISALSANTSIPTTDLGKKLIDDYVAEVRTRVPRSQATLSLVDLAELKGTVPTALAAFSSSTTELIDGQEYRQVSDARAGAKEFSPQSRLNQVDLIHFAENLGTPEATALADALRGCVKYNRTSTNIANANGLSVFFPYGGLGQVGSMLDAYEQIGIGDEYREFVRSFASVSAGGQVAAPSGSGMLDVLLSGGQAAPSGGGSADAVAALLEAFLASGDYGRVAPDAADWLDAGRVEAAAGLYGSARIDPASLTLSQVDGQRVLSLTDDQWDIVQYMEMNVFVDDGEGFIDLGLDNVYEFTPDGDLVMEYDGTWLALNGHIVSYHLVSEDRDGDTYTIRGRVPALLNDVAVDIIVVFDDENPYGRVLGAQRRYDAEAETPTIAKGLIDIVAGDRIDYLCDYYTYEGEYSDTYMLGDPYTATGTWEIENLPIDSEAYQMTYRITDIYGNSFWTPAVSD